MSDEAPKLTLAAMRAAFERIKNACSLCGGNGYRLEDPSLLLERMETGAQFPAQREHGDWMARGIECSQCGGTGRAESVTGEDTE